MGIGTTPLSTAWRCQRPPGRHSPRPQARASKLPRARGQTQGAAKASLPWERLEVQGQLARARMQEGHA
eukprot:1838588-Pyramimonas_sp.AAC.1